MLKQILTLFVICFAGFGALAQTEKYDAPVRWERYKVSDKDVSVLFPKLPILIQRSDACSETEIKEYAVYAEEVVYGLSITFQSDREAPDYCRKNVNTRKFDKKSFEDRLKELTSALKTENAKKITLNNSEAAKVSNENFAYWLVNDFTNKRWFEIWTTEQNENNLKINDFIESFKIEKNPSGIEIEKGADRTLGDESIIASNENKITSFEVNENQNLRVVVKPKPAYTEAARQAAFSGAVRLRVTFLANGGIGAVTPVTSLSYGLTEQAIAAAKKTVFIPQRKNNVNITTAKLVEYGFTLY